MILTPGQIDKIGGNWADYWVRYEGLQLPYDCLENIFETIFAYADVVRKVAEMYWNVHGGLLHAGQPNLVKLMEIHLAARRLRGLDATPQG